MIVPRPVCVGLLCLLFACAGEKRRPNVVLISIDTLRADHVGCYGYERPTTPNIDRLAAEGTRITPAYSASSWTVPSHMTLLTSLPPALHGVDTLGKRLDPARITLAERLRDAGYQTAAFVSGPTMHAAFGFDQGFEYYHNTTNFDAADFTRSDPTFPSAKSRHRSHQEVDGPTIASDVTGWLGHAAKRPFFLFVHLWDPHYDYIPSPPYDTRFDPSWKGDFDFSNVEFNMAIGENMPARALRHLVALYDGEIAATDAVVGRIIDTLAAQGWLDDTLVVLTSDHGEEFFEHGNKGHMNTLYEEVLRVPLVFRLPGVVRENRRVDAIVGAVHVMPTILGILGVSPGPEAQGRDLSAMLRGHAPPADLWAFAELANRRRFPLYSARIGDRKYIGEATAVKPLAMTVTYFGLHGDPQEQHPLPATDADGREVARRLVDHVNEMWSAASTLPRGGTEAPVIGDEQRRQLKALGYLRDETHTDPSTHEPTP